MDREKLAAAFVKHGLLDAQESVRLLEENLKHPKESLEDTLVRLKYASEEEAIKVVAEHLGIPFMDLSSGVDPSATRFIPLNLASRHTVFPVREEDGALHLAMKDPSNMETLDLTRFAAGMPVRPYLAAPSAIERAIHAHYRVDDNIADYMRDVPEEGKSFELVTEATETDLRELKKKSQAAPVVHMANSLLFQGISKGCSDIHVEPREEVLIVRHRVDGILTEAARVPKWIQPALTSRIKIMAGMDIAEKRMPQDGRIKIRVDGKDLDLRVSTLPTQHGEKIVLRILDSHKSAPTLGDIGFHPNLIAPIKDVMNLPQGMFLVCGPTGSGKTTTLYGLLSEIVKKKINIVTIEDPIEYVLPGINQVQVNEKAGLTFANSLRSILRQDPNVVFLGEIRDAETADIALRAAMTGHLVLSTVHTNDAAATVTRLLDLNIEPYLAASSLSGILAQRLIRTICNECREEHRPDPAVVKKVENAFGAECDFLFYHGKGCDRCGGTGYRGRMGLHEFLFITPEIREIIRTSGASEAKIRQAGRKEGFRTLMEDALDKMKMGLTTVEEVERVVVFTPDEEEASACGRCGRKMETDWNSCPYCGGAEKPGSSAPVAISFPSAPPPVLPPEGKTPPAPPTDPGTAGLKVLIVEDEEDVARPLAMHLLKQRFSVAVAANGQEALDAIAADRPDILLTDVLMPGMDGLELVRRLRRDAETAFMPIIIFSQKNAVEDRLKGFEAGSDDFLPKPFDPKELTERVKAILRRVRFNAQNH